MEDDNPLSFNFWPSFADMMLALVLVLCLALFLVAAVIALGTVNLKEVEANQMSMINSIAADYKVQPSKLADNTYGIYFNNASNPDIEIHNDLNSQRITFSDKILFEPDHIEIKPAGEQVLMTVGQKLRVQLNLIREIQIQGHADTLPSQRYRSNVELAANRAIAVFTFLQDPKKVGINPAEHLMSVTSFGEYNSVRRTLGDAGYDQNKLRGDNETEDLRRRNRRIELVLIYRR
jgi:flagellar motor protein MotB